MENPTSVDSNGMKKGTWSEEEDNKLRAYIQRYGHWNWRLLPKFAGLSRCGKSCRLRWLNYLKPGVKRGNFSVEEVNMIIELHAEHGNKWSVIAAKLPGRTDNEIKNLWNTRLGKDQEHINMGHTNSTEISYEDQEVNEDKSYNSIFHETGQNESTSLDGLALSYEDQELNEDKSYDSAFPENGQNESTFSDWPASSSHTNPSSPLATKPSQVNSWPDLFLPDTSLDGHIHYYPPLPEEDFFYPEFTYGDLSSSGNPSYAQPSFPPEDVGGVYDPYSGYFDHGIDLFSYEK